MESRKMVRIYLQGSSGEIENRLMDMGRGEERVRCRERVSWKFILPYVKQIANGNLLYWGRGISLLRLLLQKAINKFRNSKIERWVSLFLVDSLCCLLSISLPPHPKKKWVGRGIQSQDFTLQCGSKCLSTAYTTPSFTLEGKNPAHHIWVLLLLV